MWWDDVFLLGIWQGPARPLFKRGQAWCSSIFAWCSSSAALRYFVFSLPLHCTCVTLPRGDSVMLTWAIYLIIPFFYVDEALLESTTTLPPCLSVHSYLIFENIFPGVISEFQAFILLLLLQEYECVFVVSFLVSHTWSIEGRLSSSRNRRLFSWAREILFYLSSRPWFFAFSPWSVFYSYVSCVFWLGAAVDTWSVPAVYSTPIFGDQHLTRSAPRSLSSSAVYTIIMCYPRALHSFPLIHISFKLTMIPCYGLNAVLCVVGLHLALDVIKVSSSVSSLLRLTSFPFDSSSDYFTWSIQVNFQGQKKVYSSLARWIGQKDKKDVPGKARTSNLLINSQTR